MDEKLTSDERYYIAVLAIMGGIPDPLPPGVLKVKRDELDAVMARMNAPPFIVRTYDSYRLMCDNWTREIVDRVPALWMAALACEHPALIAECDNQPIRRAAARAAPDLLLVPVA